MGCCADPICVDEFAYDWRREASWYDLLHSFYAQPLFNSENHIIYDGTPAIPFP